MPLTRLEQEYRAGRYMAALREFQRLMVELPNDDPAMVADLYVMGGLIQIQLGDIFASAKLLELGLEKAPGARSWLTIGKARYNLGVAWRRIGDTYQALHYYREFLADLPNYPTLAPFEGAAHYNLALTYRQRNDLIATVEHYRLAEQFMTGSASPNWLIRLYQNMAWVYYDLEDFHQGDACAERAVGILATVEDEEELKVSQHLVTALGSYYRLDHVQVVRACEEVMAPGRATAEQQAWAAWIMAEVCLRLGEFHQAGLMINMGLNLVIQVKEPRLINSLSGARRRLHAAGGTQT